MKASNNVIMFPQRNFGSEGKVAPPQSIEEIHNNMDYIKHVHIQETIATIAPKLFEQLTMAGYDLTDEGEDDIKGGAFLVESIRSLLCKYYGIFHPFQEIAEMVFLAIDEEGTLTIAERIEVDLKNRKETADAE